MKKNTTKNGAIKTDTMKTRNIVERRSEYRLQPEGFERRDFPAEAGTLNAVCCKSESNDPPQPRERRLSLARLFKAGRAESGQFHHRSGDGKDAGRVGRRLRRGGQDRLDAEWETKWIDGTDATN